MTLDRLAAWAVRRWPDFLRLLSMWSLMIVYGLGWVVIDARFDGWSMFWRLGLWIWIVDRAVDRRKPLETNP